jgi:DNA-binding beta-propeller fold protein YncE
VSKPLRRAAIALVACLLASPGAQTAHAATSSHQIWKALYDSGGGRNDDAFLVRVSPSGKRVYVTGRSDSRTYPQTDLVTVAYTSSGRRLWLNRYTGDWSSEPTDMVVSPNGKRVYVAANAYERSGGGGDYLVLAYTSGGKRVWARRYDDAKHKDDQANAIGTNAAGSRIYVTGLSFGRRTSLCGGGSTYDASDIATVAWSSAGTRLWVRRYDNTAHSNDDGIDIAVDRSTGAVDVAGVSQDCLAETVVLSYRPSGALAWKQVVAPGNSYGINPVGIAVDGAGGKVFVEEERATAYSYFNSEFQTEAYSASTGSLVWSRRYKSSKPANIPRVLVLGPNHRLYVAGTTGSRNLLTSLWEIVSYRESGSRVWTATYRGRERSTTHQPFSLAASADGSVVYAEGYVNGGNDWRLVAFGTGSGVKLWSAAIPNPRAGTGSLSAAPSGHRVYLTIAHTLIRGGFNAYDSDYDTRAFG